MVWVAAFLPYMSSFSVAELIQILAFPLWVLAVFLFPGPSAKLQLTVTLQQRVVISSVLSFCLDIPHFPVVRVVSSYIVVSRHLAVEICNIKKMIVTRTPTFHARILTFATDDGYEDRDQDAQRPCDYCAF